MIVLSRKKYIYPSFEGTLLQGTCIPGISPCGGRAPEVAEILAQGWRALACWHKTAGVFEVLYL
jgi:hypothetical protein